MFTVIFANWWKKTSFRWQKLFFWQDSFFLFFPPDGKNMPTLVSGTNYKKHTNHNMCSSSTEQKLHGTDLPIAIFIWFSNLCLTTTDLHACTDGPVLPRKRHGVWTCQYTSSNQHV